MRLYVEQRMREHSTVQGLLWQVSFVLADRPEIVYTHEYHHADQDAFVRTLHQSARGDI